MPEPTKAQLLAEVEALRRELAEAHERQIATSEILGVIRASLGKTQPVFDTIVQNAMRLLGGTSSAVLLLIGDEIHRAAIASPDTPGYANLTAGMFPMLVSEVERLRAPAAIAIRERVTVACDDVEADPRISDELRQRMISADVHSGLVAPMVRDGGVIGVVTVNRKTRGAITDREKALLQTFADQAVIAIENARLLTELQEKNESLTESLDRQTATSEILRVISESPTDVRPVFEVIAAHACRLCDGVFANVVRFDGTLMHNMAENGFTAEEREVLRRAFPSPPSRSSMSGRAILAASVVYVEDVTHDLEFGVSREMGGLTGHRAMVSVPMLHNGAPVGAITVARLAVGRFADHHVNLLKTFADQAVIAIENVRLFSELQQKNEALTQAHAQVTESLDHQTATSEILRVISRSQTDVQPVFDTIVQSAVRLCAGLFGALFQFDGELLHMVAHHNYTPEALEAAHRVYPARPSRDHGSVRAIVERAVVHIPDVELDPEHQHRELRRAIGQRSGLFVPMLREGDPIGVIMVARPEPGPFSSKQIELLKTFADQAVIAIENVRLFTELQTSNRDLTTALDTQTATSDILRVISHSQTDVQPVFDAIVHSAVRLLGAYSGALTRVVDDRIELAALTSSDPVGDAMLRARFPQPLQAAGAHARVIHGRQVSNIADTEASLEATDSLRAIARARGFRSWGAVPMLRRDEAIGAITVSHREPGGFTDDEIALLQTFADQAVIAIENARLLSELQERNEALTQAHAQVTEALEQQTATSEILRVISRSPNDLQPVFDSIAASALRLCDAKLCTTFRFDGDLIHLVASRHVSAEGAAAYREAYPARPGRGGGTHRAVLTRTIVHIPDIRQDPEYELKALARANDVGCVLAVPMLRDGHPVGAITVGREAERPFSDEQIELLRTFADQAVIAIENVRLFTELQTSNRELTTALDTQTATGDILRVISRAQTNVQPVFDTILASAVRLLGAYAGLLTRLTGEQIEIAALTSTDDAGDALLRAAFPHSRHSEGGHAQVIRDRVPLNVADAWIDPRVPTAVRAAARARGNQSLVVVPLLRRDEAVGAIGVTRRDPGGFTDDEIALLETFADQAVIAIENARLLTELQARTDDLARSVGELRALSEIGQAIGSTLDLQTVLAAIVGRATDLAGADAGAIYEYDVQREVFEPRASERLEGEIVRELVATPIRKGQGVTGRLAEVLAPIQTADISVGERILVRELLIRAGYRALLAVPLVREGLLIGGLTVFRKTPGAYADNVVDLLQTFATQSALAIQNARLFREIEIKSRELEVASQHKSEFLASMSHELRTPLNAIIGFSDVLLQGMFGEMTEKQTEYLQDILASGQHLLSLINDILDLSKIEAGRMDLDLADFHLPSAIDDALLLMRERGSRRGLTLERNVDERLGQIRADQRKLKQVLLNLLSNAVKFTPEGGRIAVRAALVDGTVEISVTDTGIGIAPADQETVFEEFRQVGKSDKKAEGTGLGLALCRRFVELHGGRIWLTSELGKGSTFTFTMPVNPPSASA